MLTVSVVIPSYNSASYLGEALKSVRDQTRPADEVIVVDDRSSDGTAEIARAAGAVCLSTPRNAGPSAARNIGISAARGDLVAFLDADDVWEPHHLATLVPLLERNPEAALAYSRVRKFGVQTGDSPPSLPEGTPTEAFWTLLRTNNVIPQMAAVVRREALLAAGGYEESMRHSEDYDLWLRIAWRRPFVCSRQITGWYRTHASQTTAGAAPRMARAWWSTRGRALELVRREGTAADVARAAEALREAWSDDLRWAWWQRERALFEAVLGEASRIPDAEPVRRKWEHRYRLAWRPWCAIGGAWDALPLPMRRALRAPLRPLLNPP
jgi:glycosyltransferase involved in cell wall biosynthesis